MQVSRRQQNRRAVGQGPEPATAEPGLLKSHSRCDALIQFYTFFRQSI